jgi:hypothetical protein
MSSAHEQTSVEQESQSFHSAMALSFIGGSVTLANWGFSVGDIAVMAGAGRNATTWVLAQFKDQNLIDWMGFDVDTILKRKAICDTTELHSRWDARITLMQNGQKTSITSKGGTVLPVIESMGRFTWLMTLITAALNSAMQKSTMHELLVRFLLKLFEDNKSGEDFLRNEAAQHIQGWLSAAVVRSIAFKAQNLWDSLGKNKQHPPGYIPHAELDAIHHFLLWLVAGEKEDTIYRTPSTDIFCLAIVLESIGLKIKTTLNANEAFDEADVSIIWSNQLAPTALVRTQTRFRPGMRIPLSHMEEVASIFPRSDDRNKLRGLFESGMEAVKLDGIILRPAAFQENLPRVKGSPFLESEQDLYFEVQISSRGTIPKLVDDTNRISEWLLPVESPTACRRLVEIMGGLGQSSNESHNVHMLAFSLDNQQENNRSYGLKTDYDYGDALIHLQAFFLGYWYKLLLPLLDTSQLESQEGFGSWSWADLECLDFIREMVRTRMHQRTKSGKRVFLYRFEVMKLTAYLFGGAEIGQIRRATFGSVGIMGKVPVLYSSLVRGRPENFGKFSLLDIDASAIPSSDNGIVVPGDAKATQFLKSPEVVNRSTAILPKMLRDVHIETLIKPNAREEDFTLHIEPDWNNDSQTCLVVYRHKGRVITRANPRQIDLALAHHIFDKEAEEVVAECDDNSPPYQTPVDCEIIRLSAFQGGRPVEPEEQLIEIAEHVPGYVFKPLILQTAGMINAFLCISCLYEGWETKSRLVVVSTQSEFDAAVSGFAKVVVIMPSLRTS